MHKIYLKPVAFLLVPLLLASCATTGGPGASANGGTGESSCNPAVTGAIGAVVGALIGGGKDRLAGEAVGGAIGALACVAFNHHSEQVKTAQQVETDYRKGHRGNLPEQATVVRYSSAFEPATIKAGSEAKMASYIEVLAGRNAANPVIEEEIALYKPDGALVRKARKPVSEAPSAGAFQNTFTIPMPAGVPQGLYRVTTDLYVNGVAADHNDSQLQVVMASPVTDTVSRLATR